MDTAADVTVLAEQPCPPEQSLAIPISAPSNSGPSSDHDVVGVPTMVGVPVHGKHQDTRKAFQYQYSVASAWWQRWYQWYSRSQPSGSVPWSIMQPHGAAQQTSATAAPQAQPPSPMLQSQTSADDTACKPSFSAPGSDTGDDSLHPMSASIVPDNTKLTKSGELKVCKNCGTDCTPFWRKDKSDQLPLCNACGLYAAKNGSMRPEALWSKDEHQQQHQNIPCMQPTSVGLPAFGPEPQPQQPEVSGAVPAAMGAPVAQPMMTLPGGPAPSQPMPSLQMPAPAASGGKETMHLPSAAELLTSGLDGGSGSSSATPVMAMAPGSAMYMHPPMLHQPSGARFIQLGTIGEQQYPILSFAGGVGPMPWRPRGSRRRRGKSTLPPLPPLPAKLPPELKTLPPDMPAPMARTQSMPNHVTKDDKSIAQVTTSLGHRQVDSEAAADAFLDGTASLDEPTFDPKEIDDLFKDDEDMVGIDVREEGGCESDMFGMDIDNMAVADDHLGSDDGLGSARAHSAPVNVFGSP